MNIDPKAQAEVDQTLQALSLVDKLQVESKEQRNIAIEIIQDLRDQKDKIEEIRKSIVGPAQQGIKAANAFFKSPKERIEAAIATLQSRIGNFEAKRSERNEAKQERAAAALQDGDGELAKQLQLSLETPDEAPGLSMRRTWYFDVPNPHLLDRKYLMVDESAIEAERKRQCGLGKHPEIVGVVFRYEDRPIVSRPRKGAK